MGSTLLLVALGLVVIVLLALPLFRRAGAAREQPSGVRAAEPGPGEAAAEALREIEFDRAMGKLSDDDYRELRAQYETQLAAAQVTAAPARPDPVPSPESVPVPVVPPPVAVPWVTRAAGATPPSDPEEHAEWLVQRARAVTVTCPDCGTRPEPDARYCSNCGRYLARCAACGNAVEELGARFCSHCGAALGA